MSEAELSEHRRHVVVHEAGHAVVGRSLGLNVVGIVIECKETTCGGYTIFTDGNTCEPVQIMKRHPEKMGPTILAGYLAEQELLGSHVFGGYRIDIDIFSTGLPFTKDVAGAVAEAQARARDLVEQHRDAIREVADRLTEVDHLMGHDLAALLSSGAG